MNAVPRIRLYTSRWCAQCEQARALLRLHGLAFEEIELDGDSHACCRLRLLTGGASAPQVVVDERPIGGYPELAALLRADMREAFHGDA